MLRSTRHLCHCQLLILFCFNTLLSLANAIPTDNPFTLNILHYHHTSSVYPKTRPSPSSRLMSNCPEPLKYAGSMCETDRSVQDLLVSCWEGTSESLRNITGHHESCTRHEICIDLDSDTEHPEAYCIANGAWDNARRGSTKPGMRNLLTAEAWVKIGVPTEGGEPVPLRAAQARLVGKYTPIKQDADFIALAAYREETVEDEPVRRVTGIDDCRGCSDVTMSPVPQGTSLLRARVIVPPHVGSLGGGTLYLFTVE